MQLFIIDFVLQNTHALIKDPEIIQQMKKVLRYQLGDICFVQKIENNLVLRYKVQLKVWDNKEIFCDILSKEERPLDAVTSPHALAIAMPNKRAKAELIVQKLSEIGIQKVFFWPSERSVIRESNQNKRQRLEKISQEATEQARNRIVPEIIFVPDLKKILPGYAPIVFSQEGNSVNGCKKNNLPMMGIVGPEGGFGPKDEEYFGVGVCRQSLGGSILRVETAAIIGGWMMLRGV